MALSKREKYIAIGVGAAAVLLGLDQFVFTPYISASQLIDDQYADARKKQTDQIALFSNRRKSEQVWKQMTQSGLQTNASAADSQLVHSLLEYADTAGVNVTSLKPERTSEENQFQIISYHLTGVCSTPQMGRLLWAIETASIPMRVNAKQVTPRKEGTDDLTLQLSVSTLSLKPPAEGEPSMLQEMTNGSPSSGMSTQPATAAVPSRTATSDSMGQGNRSGRRGRDRNSRPEETSVLTLSAGGQTPSRPFPDDKFGVLKARSIFVKGNQTLASDEPRASSRPRGPIVGKPEASLVFNGVTIVDDEANALIEDLGSHRVYNVRAGDPIAGGKVASITFDDLVYEVKGATKHVAIGQNLDGVLASADSANVGSPTTTPTTFPTGSMSPEDILARMKAKRAAELQGK